MQRLFVALLTMCSCVFAACGSGPSVAHTSDTFRSPAYRYVLERPAGWSSVPATRHLDDGEPPRTGGGGTDIFGVDASTKFSAMELPVVVIGAQNIGADVTLDEWVARVVEIVAEQKGCAMPSATEPVEVGGEQAVRLTYPNCPAGAGLFHYWTAFIHDEVAYHLVWVDESGAETEDRARLDDLCTGFAFVP